MAANSKSTTTLLGEPAPPPVVLALNLRDAAASVGLSERYFWQAAKNGQIPFVRAGRRLIFPVDELRKWLGANCERNSDETPLDGDET